MGCFDLENKMSYSLGVIECCESRDWSLATLTQNDSSGQESYWNTPKDTLESHDTIHSKLTASMRWRNWRACRVRSNSSEGESWRHNASSENELNQSDWHQRAFRFNSIREHQSIFPLKTSDTVVAFHFNSISHFPFRRSNFLYLKDL